MLSIYRKKSVVTASLIACLTTILMTGCTEEKPKPLSAPIEVGVWQVTTQPFTLQQTLVGRTVAHMTSDVRPQVSGIIKKRLFTEGEMVKEGQVLYQIDDAAYIAAYDNAKGSLAEAEASVLSAKPKVERYEKLIKIDAISQQELDEAVATLRQDEAAVLVAKAALETAKINLGYTKIKAPISGRIGISDYTPGALVTASQSDALTTIQEYDPIYVDLTQSSSQMLQLQRMLKSGVLTAQTGNIPVYIELEDGSLYPHMGTLKFVGTSVDTTTGNIKLRALLPNSEQMLLPGMYVKAILPVAVNNNAILVPQESVTYNTKGQATVKVLDGEHKVHQRVVQIGDARDNQWIVTSGLKAGEQLIIEGNTKVSDGQTVTSHASANPTLTTQEGDQLLTEAQKLPSSQQ
ncbi:efflux RND transporter periplasmic adaptor subunit [Vibrio porteresiae]|uniref:Efflux RND transporter periplasmic adaptor subunit n=1 Tax=Vibrio porteresiae DSM 19223 TaxID=1123496 RepID=A0ABZ0QJ20_9VIBR|nr:efflux RND transporter periplasmic adaptor subunit [Vibrio porteresiae]WPC76414.1 efflux RND transporter periplasmic adaptor subunit [Vibrio porteresiae DSM 19223]